ncbi:hypothetical protein P886_1692 [Alteromonadaceae bacterium 2753L.S.0a.02]|nr:hypothetical protein P886_1692 [Alteromonadaceae bacterium 2753L.S.0a.02]
MNNKLIKFFFTLSILWTITAKASDIVVIDPPVSPIALDPTLTYTVEPDYRDCIYPLCGGYWLTPVNRVFVEVPTISDADYAPVPQPVYVVEINYDGLGLSDEQIQKFEHYIALGRALIKGALVDFDWSNNAYDLQALKATATWTSANSQAAVGTYLDVKSSGIVCITTPCPYYKAQQINTYWSFLFHELNFERAQLTDAQLTLARSLVAEKSLVLTGTRFVSQGMTGDGIGIAATQVFFPYPGKTDSRQ